MAMIKYGVANACNGDNMEKTAGMGPEVGYCEKCAAPIVLIKNKQQKTCSCKQAAKTSSKKQPRLCVRAVFFVFKIAQRPRLAAIRLKSLIKPAAPKPPAAATPAPANAGSISTSGVSAA